MRTWSNWLALVWGFVSKDAVLFISYRFALVFNLFSVLFGVATYFFLGQTVTGHLGAYGDNYFQFVIVGMVVSNLLLAISGHLTSQVTQEMRGGTLEFIIAAPGGHLGKCAAMSAWNTLYAVVLAVVYLLVAGLFFDLQLRLSGTITATLLIALAAVPFFALAVLSAAAILKFKRGNPIQWMIASLQMLLGGVYFPVERLPQWLADVAEWLPLALAVEGTRKALLLNRGIGAVNRELAGLALLGLILLPVAVWVLRRTIHGVKLRGSFLEH